MPKSIVETINPVEFMGEETGGLGVVRETRRSRWVKSGNEEESSWTWRIGCEFLDIWVQTLVFMSADLGVTGSL